MSCRQWWTGLLFAFLSALAITAHAQSYATDPLKSGRLLVWVVQPSTQQPSADQIRSTFHTTTAGSFGQTAGSVGQTAGNAGRNPSELPSRVTSRPASEAGQTAGSFGRELGQLATPPPEPDAAGQFQSADLGTRWAGIANQLHSSFPDLQAAVLPVSSLDLGDRLAAANAGAVAYPDLLVSDHSLARYGNLLSGLGFWEVGARPYLAPENGLGAATGMRSWIVTGHAPDPMQARAFVVWAQDGFAAQLERTTLAGPARQPAALAISAAESYLHGEGLGGAADPLAASVLPGAVLEAVYTPITPAALAGLTLRTAVLRAAANNQFAVVSLRVIAASQAGFGVLHPLVVLRRATDGRWRVLHVSGNLPLEEAGVVLSDFSKYALSGHAEKPVTGVALAAPPDGDTRAGTPELWWSNPGDASLLVVEWQRQRGSGWGETEIVLVPDLDAHLQTRLSATFMHEPAGYRWRVWSIGPGGVLALSPWRKLTRVA